MRLWSLHPAQLDARGLVALWREGLLARAVLRGETRGYRRHPQLQRFRDHPTPRRAIDAYLHEVLAESRRRGYDFDGSKLGARRRVASMEVTRGQLACEWRHLLAKLARRAPELEAASRRKAPRAHPLFRVVPGPVAPWERSPSAGR